LRVGVAGLGFGASVHVPGLRAIPGTEVVAIAGRDLEKASKVAASLAIPKAFDSVDALLEERLDAVTFALPPKENERACRLALSKRLPVLSEKPLACSVEAALELSRMAEGIPTAVDFQFSELECFQRLKERISGRALGKVSHVHITWMVESYAHKHRKWSWKTDALQCGGVTTLLGSHLLFLLEWIFGPIEAIDARVSRESTRGFAPVGEMPADDLVDLWARHTSGVPVTATYSNACPGGIGHRWEVVCEDGVFVLFNGGSDYMKGFRLVMRTKTNKQVLVADDGQSENDGRIEPFTALARRFFAESRLTTNSFVDFSAAAKVQRLMDMVLRHGTGK
jgi:predicted dehydrogenase